MMTRRRKNSPSKELISTEDLVQIVGDGSIAGPFLEGVNVPLLILDTSDRPDIEELVRVHSLLSPGDVDLKWGGVRGNPDEVVLRLHFCRPIESRVVLLFSIERQAILVEAALTAGALYLQPGRVGDRLKNSINHPRMLVEIPDMGFRPIWNELFLKRITIFLRRRDDLPKAEASMKAKILLEELRNFTEFRMPSRG